MTVYQSLLMRGYFPKELPPAFFTEQFAKFATSKDGRTTISSYTPSDNFTECVKYRLALPGLDRRELRIAHPASFAKLAELVATNFARLLRLANSSDFSRSRPIYGGGHQRAIHATVKPGNLSRERAAIRAGSAYLLKADVSQFYPSLYTHAVGWAVDPKLRNRTNWNNKKLLGKRLDQALMDLDGKVSQGVPIGNDISFLLAEVVLAQVDKAIRPSASRAFRWFDDYELAFDTNDQAEATLKKINRELGRFRLRLNAKKTAISTLPRPAQDEWQEVLKQVGAVRFKDPREVVRYFDAAFRLRERFADVPVLLYALGMLFKVACPTQSVGRIAQSCITQALLCEPGVAQKAFALLAFWGLNGLALDSTLITRTINQMIVRHQASGFSSDIAWALAFSLEQGYVLNSKAAQVLSGFDDDFIALQALHMEVKGLLPKGFNKKRISKALKDADLDRDHWLIAYETVRQGFLTVCAPAVASNPFFSELLKRKVTFYRTTLPAYATIIHPGGAPDWVVKNWIALLTRKASRVVGQEQKDTEESPTLELIGKDLAKRNALPADPDQALVNLIDLLGAEADIEGEDGYSP
jgi:Reverse transcriptase (RNA-dependent DNA polymerase)